ncbi:hypothetical protein B5V88_05390 [Heyndrickxia sporothermodurans]|uniref:Uncharacterized protein n=1 Tax=Heyndrickxia sporothermodurans TaxID=46224 RepID=A0AB37HGT2_9BACI|nr:hypothetical protein [Heyndrickxia sporothermodurans]MBL5766576.1 hypothetical protein [Heyndrickxia sporothermodurans]MBL5770015.1 hypothetical protein [Heyndrickxia sporothermodurans]MBL5773692.1 hypothetical protein [Heyndrickxia sporothermodurans]MBL5780754.1 hypothetical protein [Heyndrickxia sporothermodurans]MBL5784384.1 hypothetical protein [Heyndrickxia sporothermodurans]
MALKKVRRPVINKPSEDNKIVQEQEQPEQEANQSGKEESSMNKHNTVNNENPTEEISETLSNTIQGSPAMERIISFGDDSVSMQRTAKVPEGIYDYNIDEIDVRENVQTQYGLKDQYVITFSLYSEVTEQVTKLSLPYNISSNQQSVLMMFLGAFKQVFKGQRITMGHLIGLTGQARVHHVTSEAGNIFEKIEVLTVENPNT